MCHATGRDTPRMATPSGLQLNARNSPQYQGESPLCGGVGLGWVDGMGGGVVVHVRGVGLPWAPADYGT